MTEQEPTREQSPTETMVEMGRLNGLSDGVFAFALTLLVLDIRIPEGVLVGDLPYQMLQLTPKLLVYLISFIVIGGAWGSHQRMLSQVRRGDGLLVWFNLLSLLFVTLLPASAALLSKFSYTFLPIACFAADVILIQLTALWMWRHASKQRLINPDLDPRVVTSIGRRLSLSAVIFTLSIPLAVWKPLVNYLVWFGTFLLLFTTDWLSWQIANQSRQAAIPLEGAQRASLHLTHAAGRLNIGASALEYDVLQGMFGGGLESKTSRSGDILSVWMNISAHTGFMSLRFPWSWGAANQLDWTLKLNNRVPVDLDIDTAGGQATLDLDGLQVTGLNVKTSASSWQVRLPANAGATNVRIEASSASFVIYIPPEVAAHILTTRALATTEIDPLRFPMIVKDREYRSDNYETAPNRVDIQVNVAIGSVKFVS